MYSQLYIYDTMCHISIIVVAVSYGAIVCDGKMSEGGAERSTRAL